MQLRNASGFQVDAWERRLVLRAPGFRYDEKHRPVRRPSITIVIALGRPFRVQLAGASAPLLTRGLIIGPNVLRDWIDAEGSELWAFDVTAGCPDFADLLPLAGDGEVHELADAQYTAVAALCRAHTGSQTTAVLLEAVLDLFRPAPGQACARDARVAAVLALVAARALDECSVVELAAAAGLSVSRLRALFRQELHCTLPYYLRLSALWKALPLLERGASFTEAAHAVGFHDHSHFHRAVTEFIGYSPTQSLLRYGTTAMSGPRG